jgi:hypothetical protein
VRDLLEGHITLELESIDRLCLNGYVPQLQHGPVLVGFVCQQRGWPIASPALLGQISQHMGMALHIGMNESADSRKRLLAWTGG